MNSDTNGEDRPWVDAELVRDHIRMLLEAKMTLIEIDRQAGVSAGSSHRVLNGTPSLAPPMQIRASIALAILLVSPKPDIAPMGRNPLGAQRRMQALACRGHLPAAVAAEAKIGRSTAQKALQGIGCSLLREIHEAIAAVYERWKYELGNSLQTQERAKRLKYAPAEAWQGVNIDDPKAEPNWDQVPEQFYKLHLVGWRPKAGYVEAKPVRDHIRMLLKVMSLAAIALDAGLTYGAVQRIWRGYSQPRRRSSPPREIRAKDAAAVLAVKANPLDRGRRGDVDATGARRRLHALMREGWTLDAIAAVAGLGRRTLDAISTGENAVIRRKTHQAICRAFDVCWGQDVSTVRKVRQPDSVRDRLVPGLAWDDEEIDNPRARPKGVRPKEKLSA